MTQKDKKLLLRDLSARLPYGVIVQYPNIFRPSEIIKRRLEEISYSLIGIDEYKININDDGIDIEYVKPYLRPIEDMTEEEWKELNCIGHIVPLYDGCFGVDMRAYCKNNQPHYRRFSDFSAIEDWLNKNHFDYHYSYDIKEKRWKTMIEKGLAIKAPARMYNTK